MKENIFNNFNQEFPVKELKDSISQNKEEKGGNKEKIEEDSFLKEKKDEVLKKNEEFLDVSQKPVGIIEDKEKGDNFFKGSADKSKTPQKFFEEINKIDLRKKLLTDKYYKEAEEIIKEKIGPSPSEDFLKAAATEIIKNLWGSPHPVEQASYFRVLDILDSYLKDTDPEFIEKKMKELETNKYSEEEKIKRQEIKKFVENYENKEESIFRFCPDGRFFTDPKGIDPVHLLPSVFKNNNLGKFLSQEFDPYSLPSLYTDSPSISFSTPPTRLIYENGSINVSQNVPFGLETKVIVKRNKLIRIDLRDRLFDGINLEKINNEFLYYDWPLYKSIRSGSQPEVEVEGSIPEIISHRWLYSDESNFTEKKLLHVTIQSKDFSKDNIWRFVATANQRFLPQFISQIGNTTSKTDLDRLMSMIEIWWSPQTPGPHNLIEFLSDPYLTLFRSETSFYKKFSLKTFKKQAPEDQKDFVEKWNRIWDLIQEYKNKEREGQKFEVLPFLPFPGEDAPPIPGLAIEILENVLEEAKKHGYEGISCDPSYFHVAENLRRMGFKFDNKKDEEIFFKIQRSLNALETERWKKFILSKTQELTKKYVKEGLKKTEAKKKAYLEARKEAQQILFTPQERSWIVLLNSVEDKTLIPDEFKLFERDEKGEVKLDRDQKPIYLSWPTKPGRAVWMTLSVKKDNIKKEGKQLESAEKIGDNLIADYVITGYTLTKEKHYLEKILKGKTQKTVIVYHMYARDSVVLTPDGEKKHTFNKQHLKQIKSLISQLGVKSTEEKGVLGNVKNPGPNKPFGWYKDPESWVKNGIEKSWQRVLVIYCNNNKEAEEVLALLNRKGWQGSEEALEGAWIIPDIRVFNLEKDKLSKDLQDNYKEAILHIKSGNDGKISTITTRSHRSLDDYIRLPILVHKAMKDFIRQNELKNGAYEVYSR